MPGDCPLRKAAMAAQPLTEPRDQRINQHRRGRGNRNDATLAKILHKPPDSPDILGGEAVECTAAAASALMLCKALTHWLVERRNVHAGKSKPGPQMTGRVRVSRDRQRGVAEPGQVSRESGN